MAVRTLRLSALLLLALLLCGQTLAGPLPDTIVYSPEVLAATKQRILEHDPALLPAYKQFIKEADRALKAPVDLAVFKTSLPPSGDKHDYWSISPYWWPDPESQNGLPYVLHDGERNPEADSGKYDRVRLRTIAQDALTLALAWYLTGNDLYAGKSAGIIWAWCCDSVTRTNPNMRYAQARPGISDGEPSGIIETRDMIKIAEAARLLEPSEAWSKVNTRKLTAWFNDYSDWMQKSEFGKLEAQATDNHGTWYDAQLAAFALYCGKITLARAIVASSDRRRIGTQIQANGSMLAELERTRSRHYTFFNLEAFFTLAAIGDRVGMDIWNFSAPRTGSIKKAFDFAAPYIARDEPWPFGDMGDYDPFLFTPLFHRAAMVYKEPRYLELLKALPHDKLVTDRAQLFY